MPQTRETAPQEPAANGGAPPVTETRVDAAHSIGDAVSAPLLADLTLAEMPLDDVPLADISLADIAVEQAINELARAEGSVQVRAQADQLATHLRERQRQLDHREAQVNARVAAFEQEIRDARAWLAQRNDELNERESHIEAREKAAKTLGVDVESPARPVDPSLGFAKISASLAATLTQGTERTKPLAAAPFDGQVPLRQMVSAQEQSAGEDERTVGWEGPIGCERPLSEMGWQQRTRALTLASQQLDCRRQALQELHDEISQMHHEALELHLVTQELQAQLRPSAATAAADEALRVARDKVARRYHQEAARLTHQRKELEGLRSDLAKEHAKLQRRYQELRGWIENQREWLTAGKAGDDSRSRPVA